MSNNVNSRVAPLGRLSDVDLYPLTSRLPTFHEIKDDEKFRVRVADKGNSLRQGFPIALSCTWLLSVHGIEYIQLYLWLIKDWSWCSMSWVYPGIIAGSLAMVWSMMLLLLAMSAGLYSEMYLAFGELLWLSANFFWMVGEFWDTNFLENGEDFYNSCLRAAQTMSLLATTTLVLYFLVLLPSGFFEYERRTNPLAMRLTDDAPPPRFSFVFKTFREYEMLHLLFWAIKDTCWIFDEPRFYALGFIPTLVLNIDLCYLYATHRNQYIDFIHCIVLLLWVLANGVWAYGEMVDENPNDPENISEEDWESYQWPFVPTNQLFMARYAAEWIFFLIPAVLVPFYVHWVYVSVYRPPLEELLVDFPPPPEPEQELGELSRPSSSMIAI